MEYSYFSLGMIGTWEAIIILAMMAGGVAGVIFLAIWLSRRTDKPTAPASAVSTVKLAVCPRCGSPLPANAPQGLCPRCVMQVGIGTQDAGDPAFKDASGKPNPPDPAELAKHFPQLEIIELLGQGGMGAVYKARQKDLDRMVALKVLPGGGGGDPAFAERFTREARALARLSHPNIVAVHEFGQIQGSAAGPAPAGLTKSEIQSDRAGETPTGREQAPALLYYFIMEFIDGPNLRQLMHGQKLSPREAMSIVPKICEALQFAHDEGIVHRDIKPENILLDKKGRVKIADFGIAKILGKGHDASLTGAKDVIGTPHYMAPEQVEHPTEVDHRADIYSLGVVFYEMLTGELPLGNFEAPSSHMRGIQVDVRLDDVVLRSLAKAPERRYQHASEVKTDVERISAGAVKSDGRVQNAEVDQGARVSEPRRFTSEAAGSDARFSRLAIVGAGWAGFAILAVPFSYMLTGGGGPGQTLTALAFALAFTLVPLGLTAPIGTTICGVVALSQIRRAAGRLCGLGLALFDALLFPLLILDAFIVWLVYLLLCQSLVWVGFKPGTEVPIEDALLPAALIIIVVNIWLARRAWRSAKRMSGRVPTPGERGSAAAWTRIAIPVSGILLLGAAALMVASPLQSKRRVEALEQNQRERLELIKDKAEEYERTATAAVGSPAVPTHVAPVVVQTTPRSGSLDVNASLTELRVTFSKPMQDGNWSWVKLDDDTFPEMTGQPRFTDDARTCVLPVRLTPGRTYATWINVDEFQNFKDRDGNSAVPYLLIFITKE